MLYVNLIVAVVMIAIFLASVIRAAITVARLAGGEKGRTRVRLSKRQVARRRREARARISRKVTRRNRSRGKKIRRNRGRAAWAARGSKRATQAVTRHAVFAAVWRVKSISFDGGRYRLSKREIETRQVRAWRLVSGGMGLGRALDSLYFEAIEGLASSWEATRMVSQEVTSSRRDSKRARREATTHRLAAAVRPFDHAKPPVPVTRPVGRKVYPAWRRRASVAKPNRGRQMARADRASLRARLEAIESALRAFEEDLFIRESSFVAGARRIGTYAELRRARWRVAEYRRIARMVRREVA